MKTENLRIKIINATKWSAITELVAKLVTPVTNMVLARIIAPEAFGVVATITMIISFVDMITDAGFQKYLIQHEYVDEIETYKNANVAFWTNLGISACLWLLIIVFCEEIALVVGNPGLGNVISISCVQLLFTSFSSVQMALFKRDFDFKPLFIARIISVCTPFLVTIPLAFLGMEYWALVIGSIFMKILNTLVLTVQSKWKPKLFYNFIILKEMLSFSLWSLIEAISIWFTTWADVFIIGTVLNQYYLGLYKISTSMVNTLMSLITASTIPVLFSALSRLQDDPQRFNNLYFNSQKLVSIFVFPLGIGIYLYSDLATKILLGGNWNEASGVIGVWALTSSIMIVFGYFCSEVYRSKGMPKLSFLAQSLHLIVLVPVCVISSGYGFWTLVNARAWIRMEFVLVHLIIMKFAIGISVVNTLKNVTPTLVSAVAMGLLGYWLKHMNSSILWDFASIFICSIFYISILYLFPSMKGEMNIVVTKMKALMKGGGVKRVADDLP